MSDPQDFAPGATQAPPLTHLEIPLTSGGVRQVAATEGGRTVVVGANGSGKSALGLRLAARSTAPGGVKRILGHRRLWFESAGPNMTAAGRQQFGQQISNFGIMDDQRYVDRLNAQGPDMTLFDVFARITSQNAAAVKLYQTGKTPVEVESVIGAEILAQLNGAFRSVDIPIKVTVTDGQMLSATKTTSGLTYPINSMSDGEKSIFLLTGEVLTAPSHSLIVIDEPERHLHRSISSAVIEYLIATRSDAHFLVLTHDLDLAVALGENALATTLCVFDCVWAGQSANSWTLQEVPNGEGLPDSVRLAVLGGRSRVLFVEGASLSLDAALYKIIFPEMVITPAGGSDQVMQAVRGLAGSEAHHWIEARGIVDGDERDAEERSTLLSKGVLALPTSEIENIYYCEEMVRAVAKEQAVQLELNYNSLMTSVQRRGIELFQRSNVVERLASKFAVSRMRKSVLEHVPTQLGASVGQVQLTLESSFDAIRAELQQMIDSEDVFGLMLRVPIRDVGFPTVIAKVLHFDSASDYQARARSLLRGSEELLTAIRARIGAPPPPAVSGQT